VSKRAGADVETHLGCSRTKTMIKNSWYVAANPAELVDGRILARTILGTPLVLYRLEGQVIAAYDRCPHRFVPLSIGKVVGDTLQCGYHGARFNKTGKCVSVPGQRFAPGRSCALQTFPAVERCGFVWVWMGQDTRTAESPALPETFAIGASSAWDGDNGLFESLQANFMLINDNLFDITHADFVHSDSFGGRQCLLYRTMEPGSEYQNGKMVYEVTERGIALRLLDRNVGNAGGPFFREQVALGLGIPEFTGDIDTEFEVIWTPPSFTSFRVTVNPSDNRAARFSSVVLHAVTPEWERASHYFFRAVRDYAHSPELTAAFVAGMTAAFKQDKVVIELQQQRIGFAGLFEQGPAAFAGDLVQLRARKLIEKMAAERLGRGGAG
jgi:phenylpropionate dioxygenase-like ring-hydroxylating dioxygenase large terminal subunit